MNVVIVEDEHLVAENLAKLLKEVMPEIHIQNILPSVKEAISWFTNNQTDLILLDIHLSDGNSFHIFEQVEINTPVIFTTSYDQYAIEAFKLWSIDYLLKPIGLEQLKRSLEKFHRVSSSVPAISYTQLHQILEGNSRTHKKRFLVQFGNKIQSVPTSEIACFNIQEREVFLHTFEGKCHALDYSLDQLESLLSPEQFFRINRKTIVNIEAVQKMYYLSPGKICIEIKGVSKDETVVSLSRAVRFKKWLNE